MQSKSLVTYVTDCNIRYQAFLIQIRILYTKGIEIIKFVIRIWLEMYFGTYIIMKRETIILKKLYNKEI